VHRAVSIRSAPRICFKRPCLSLLILQAAAHELMAQMDTGGEGSVSFLEFESWFGEVDLLDLRRYTTAPEPTAESSLGDTEAGPTE
jgi:hypothetical protein